jgi:hypothetical protein
VFESTKEKRSIEPKSDFGHYMSDTRRVEDLHPNKERDDEDEG